MAVMMQRCTSVAASGLIGLRNIQKRIQAELQCHYGKDVPDRVGVIPSR